VTLGRRSRCDIQLPFEVVSSHHLTFERDGPDYRVRDEGSTNGLKIDGEWVEPNEWQPVRDGMTLQIVELRIEVRLEQSLAADVDELTLAETDTLARNLLGDALEDEDADLAYFEIVEGPSAGRTWELPDDVSDAVIGTDEEALVCLPAGAGPARAVTVSYTPEGFVVRTAEATAVRHNGEPVGEAASLADGDTLAIGECRLAFVDPLEAELEEFGGLDGIPEGRTSPSDEDVSEERTGEPPLADGGAGPNVGSIGTADVGGESRDDEAVGREGSSWGLLETALLLVTLLFVLLVVLILLVTFGVA